MCPLRTEPASNFPATPSLSRNPMDTLFDLPDEPTGRQLRDEGVAALLDADAAPHRGRRQYVEDILDTLIASGRVFDADDVRRALPDEVRNQLPVNLVPACFGEYSRQGRIKQVGWSRSRVRSRHSGAFRRWIGAACIEEAA
jgi:hypothetical protein